jgi:hypothetical protein
LAIPDLVMTDSPGTLFYFLLMPLLFSQRHKLRFVMPVVVEECPRSVYILQIDIASSKSAHVPSKIIGTKQPYKMRSALGGMWPVKPLNLVSILRVEAAGLAVKFVVAMGQTCVLTGYHSHSRYDRVSMRASRDEVASLAHLVISRVAFSPTFMVVTPSSQPRIVNKCSEHRPRRKRGTRATYP